MNKCNERGKENIVFKIGVVLLLISILLWLSLLVIPFLPLSVGFKAGVAASVFIAAEVTFWLGVICTGREFVRRYKDRFIAKFRRGKKQAGDGQSGDSERESNK